MNDHNTTVNPMSSSAPAAFPPFFRRRTLGRAPSPPTWACYEQIPPPVSDSDEDDNDRSDSDSQSGSDSDADQEHERHRRADSPCGEPTGDMDMEMEIPESAARAGSQERMDVDGGTSVDEHACGSAGEQCDDDDCEKRMKRKDKGKQRAVDPEPETLQVEKTPKRRHRRRKHESPILYRPILTIKKSEGFVWNQDLFVPSYIKDRYVASTSPPSNGCSTDTSIMSPIPASEFQDTYEIEVVEIRVQGNELDGILS